jgi:hypothetical protein
MTLAEDGSIAQAVEYVKLSNRMLEVRVVAARKEGRTWGSIGDELGVTHQGARAKWSPIVSKALEIPHTNGADSANGTGGASDSSQRVDGDSAAGPGHDRDRV